jgi:hypothetical protein
MLLYAGTTSIKYINIFSFPVMGSMPQPTATQRVGASFKYSILSRFAGFRSAIAYIVPFPAALRLGKVKDIVVKGELLKDIVKKLKQ